MTDKELLELAAKAAGLEIVGDVDRMICQPDHRAGGYVIRNDRGGDSCWNPITDDGDALRLAVKCGIEFYEGAGDGPEAWAGYYLPGVKRPNFTGVSHDNDPYAATRRAIVRAAAEIGKGMK